MLGLSALWIGSLWACSADQDRISNPLEPAESAQVQPKPIPVEPRRFQESLGWAVPEPHDAGDGGSEDASMVPPRPCTKDDECAPGFCDRTVCAMPGRGGFGRTPCEPDAPEPVLPPPPPGMRWGAPSEASDCASYHCIEKRCRSCLNDSECEAHFVCSPREGFPGRSCMPEPKK